jgi:CRP-like cAMP-binding protein
MPKSIADEEIANCILRALPPAIFNQILTYLKLAEFRRGHVICRPREPVRHIHFVNRGLVSVVKAMRDGRTVEVGTRGIEGITTPEALFGIDTSILGCVVQIPASVFSIRLSTLRTAMEKSHTLNALLQGYIHLAAQQFAQTAACNRLHTLEQRCCRWLLIAHDSARSDTFPLTHEFLAMMLGVQRPGVSITAAILQKAGFIDYARGRITITDRAGLEESACECYDVIRDQFDQLFHYKKPSA